MKSSGDHSSSVHVVPVSTLLVVFTALMLLTAITVAATWVNLGSWNIVLALTIATIKGLLVALYFMHLRYDAPFNGFLLVAALVFLALFLVLTLVDMAQIQPDAAEFRLLYPR